MGAILYTIISVIIISLVSVIAAIPLLIKKKVSKKLLLFFLSLSVGVLLATVFIGFFPEIAEHEFHINTGLFILAGFLIMFLLEKFIHWHHNKKCEGGDCHGHAYNLAPINLIGDAVHNFIDGLVIAGSYAVNFTVGLTATMSIIFHEVPQEIADFGVLLYSGMSKTKALIFNLISAVAAIVGAVVGILLAGKTHNFSHFIIPFAAGNFIYIAASNLVPELHRHCKLKDSLLHFLAIILGVAIIVLIAVYAPEHAH